MITIVPYRSEWPSEFGAIAARIRAALADRAPAIHHIGSTSVPGLDAKDIIDIQVTTADLMVREAMAAAGFLESSRPLVDHQPPGMQLAESELTKLVFGNPDRRAHIHVRVAGRFNQRYPLLCRDYLRSHPLAAAAYGEIKRQLARRFPDDQVAYYDIKDPVFDVLMAGANEWAATTGWQSPPTDA